jgi:hypothetical protein
VATQLWPKAGGFLAESRRKRTGVRRRGQPITGNDVAGALSVHPTLIQIRKTRYPHDTESLHVAVQGIFRFLQPVAARRLSVRACPQ